jgi:Asp-tRNA(Asn)/Glu-tRNA(Gln) amidotransferase A subunit family amidase
MKRREFLSATALVGATALARASVASDVSDLTDLTAVAAIDAMKRGEVTAERYARALLDRAEATRSLNAFRFLDPHAVLEAAHAADRARASAVPLGLLHGLPIPVKDSVNTRGVPTSNGTAALRDFRPQQDAALLKPLFAQGAIMMGKTNIHELSFGWTSNNHAYGAVHNPYDPTRIPGGSSGGSGAAVAARVAPLAIAEDTQGSIRIPATMCGLAGLRPTYGRYPGEGILPITIDKFDQPGPVAHTVADLALFDTAVTGDATPLAAVSLRDVRIGIAPDFHFEDLDSEVARITQLAIAKVREAGATVVTVQLPDSLTNAPLVTGTIQVCEVLPALTAFLEQYGGGVTVDAVLAQLGPNVRSVFEAAVLPPNGVPKEACAAALARREIIKAAVQSLYAQHRLDALMFPPALTPPLPIADYVDVDIGGRKVPLTTVMGRNTALGSCASLACLVLPAGLTKDGLPVGVEFDALPGSDRKLLAMGLALERALGSVPGPRL